MCLFVHRLISTHHFNRLSVLSSSFCQCKTSIWICPISITSIFQASNWTVSSIGWRLDRVVMAGDRTRHARWHPLWLRSASCQSPDTHDMKWRGFAINNPLITCRLANFSAYNVALRIKYSKHCKISEVNINWALRATVFSFSSSFHPSSLDDNAWIYMLFFSETIDFLD